MVMQVVTATFVVVHESKQPPPSIVTEVNWVRRCIQTELDTVTLLCYFFAKKYQDGPCMTDGLSLAQCSHILEQGTPSLHYMEQSGR